MSGREKLSKRLVDAAKPRATRYILWDAGLAGFGLRVEPSGSKTFIARYRAGGGRSGILRQATLGRYGVITPEEARTRARRILGAAADGKDPVDERKQNQRSGTTVGQVCDWYLEQAQASRLLGRRRRPIKASTLAMDRSRIETHIKPLLGKRAVRDLTPHLLEEMQADIAAGKTARPKARNPEDDKRPRGGSVTGGESVAGRSLGMLRTILEHARRKGIIENNPARGTRRLADRRRTTRLSLDQIRALGEALSDAADRGETATGLAAIRFILLSGFRRQEALALEHSWLVDEGGVNFPDTKSGAQIRPLGQAAMEVLRAQPVRSSCPWVFPADHGVGHFIGVRRLLLRVADRAGLENVTPHVLRHTYASIAGDLGYSDLTIAGLLGHAGRGSTSIYVHLDRSLVAAADRVAESIDSALATQSQRADTD